jgi:hypothetical protein
MAMYLLRIALIIIFALVYPVAADIAMFAAVDSLPPGFLPWVILLLPPLIAFWFLPLYKENRISLITGISIIYVVIFYIIFVYLPMPYLDWVGTMPDLNGTEKIRPRSRY